jgi:alkylation response protein AidB-like acyl-CoA dehydrogenase
MDFSIPQTTETLLARIRSFMEREVYPLEEEARGKRFRALLPRLEEVRRKVREEGLWAPQVATEYGGLGLGFMEHALVCEELAKSPYGMYVFNAQAPDAGNMEILHEFGSEAQKERWLRPLAAGAIRSCFAMTEPEHAGSNPVWMSTTAVRDGGDYVIDGHKWFTTSADGAAFAVAMVVTDPDAPPHERASQIIVPAGTRTPGYRRVRNIPCMGEEGEDWESHGEIRFESCRVPRENLLGREGQGFAIAQARLGPGRIHHCMRWIGISERSLDLMCRRAATRETAPGELLAARQTVQNWIAESRAEIDAARLLVHHAGWKIDKRGIREARVDVSLIKFFVAGVMTRVVDRALQAHGALGFSDDTVLSRFYRHERASRIYDGPDEVHKAVVARRILKEYGVGRESS